MAVIWRATKLRNTSLWIGNKLFQILEDGTIDPQPSAELMADVMPHPSFTKVKVALPDSSSKKAKPKAKPAKKAEPKTKLAGLKAKLKPKAKAKPKAKKTKE